MADLTFLTTFHADWNAVGITGDTWDPGFNPDAFRPWCDVLITPRLIGQDSEEIRITEQTPKLSLLLLPVPARLESGVLKAVRQPAPPQETPTAAEWEEQDESVGVPLTAETPALELPPGVHLVYDVKFGPMKIQGGTYTFDDFTFAAPTTATRIHLTTVERINTPPSAGNDVVLRMIPDDVTLVGPNKIQFWSNGIALGSSLTVEVSGGGSGPGGPIAWADVIDKPAAMGVGDTADAARTAIGAIGNTELTNAVAASAGNLQPADPDLTAIAALPSTANRLPYATGPAAWSLTEFSPFGRSVVALSDAAALRVIGGLVIGTNVQAYSTDLTNLVNYLASAPGTTDRMVTYNPNTDTWSSYGTSAFGRSLLPMADAPAFRTAIGALAAALVGAANGVAPLDANALIPSTYLPSYVDDVLEFATLAGFPATGEAGKIYTALNAGTPADPSKIYRWSGSTYVEISPSPGSTDAVPEGTANLYYTAARANAAADARITAARGVTIQAHSSILTAIAALALANDSVLQVKGGAVTQRTPAQLKTDLALVKADVGLGNVDNTSDQQKPISTATQTALDGKQPIVEAVNVVPAAGAAQTIPDPAAGPAYQSISRLTLTAPSCALTFPAPAAGKSLSLALTQDATGGRLVTWPASVRWAGGTAPTLTPGANKTDRITFLCDDGATWAGFVAGLNFA